MTHRRAVVQGLQTDNVIKAELRDFWIPCMNTVKSWAERNDWSYHFFNESINSYDVQTILQVPYRVRDSRTRSGQFYKLQWVASLCDQYDEILWLDSDIYIWGNPHLPQNEFHNLKCMYTRHVLAWRRPNFSIFWSSSDTIREMNEWNNRMLFNPSERGEIYSCLLTLAQHDCLEDRNEFTEEVSFIDWTETHADRVTIIPYKTERHPNSKWDWAYTGRYLIEVCKPDSFLHVSDHPKQNLLQRFLAYKAYHAYLSNLSK